MSRRSGQQLPGPERDAVELDGGNVVRREPGFGLEHLRDAGRAVGLGPRQAEGIRLRGHDAVVGGHHESCRRVERKREVLERDHPGPVVRARAGDREQSVRSRPHGNRSGGGVADVALDVGVDEVLRRRPQEPRALEELGPVARGGDGEERLRGAIARVEARPGKRHGGPETAGPRQHVGDQGSVHGVAHRDDGVGLASHADRLAALPEPLPLPAVAVAGRIVRVQLFDEEVLHVRLERRQAPGDSVVVADDHARKARQRGSGRAKAGRVERGEIPDRRRAQAEVRIVGEDRPAARRARARNDPGVAAPILAGGQAEAGERVEGARQLDPGGRREAGGGTAGHRRRRGGPRLPALQDRGPRAGEREKLRRPLGPDRLDEPRPADLVARVAREVPGHHPSPHEAVDRRPGLRRDRQEPELDGAGRIRDEKRVDSRAVGLDQAPRLRGEAGPGGLGGAAEPDRAQQPVRRNERLPQDLGQAPRSDPPLELHLPEPVPRVRVPEAEHHVGDRLRPDRGHAARIRFDADGRGVARDVDRSAHPGKRPPDQPAGIERRGRERRREDEKRLFQGASRASSRSWTRDSVSWAASAPSEAQEHVPLGVPDVALRAEEGVGGRRPRRAPSTTRGTRRRPRWRGRRR